MKNRWKYLIFFLVSIVVLYLCGIGLKNFLLSTFEICCVNNTGAAFNLFSSCTSLLIVISLIAIMVILAYFYRNYNKIALFEFVALSFLSAGILGNLSERIIYGHVIDFIDISFLNFPVFNISDIFITVGTVLLIIDTLKNAKSK